MWFSGEWNSGIGYSSNTLVVRYQQLYYSRVDVAAGTDPFSQPAYWAVAARRGNDGLSYYFGGEWSGAVAYSNDALVFYGSAWWRSLQSSAGVAPASSGASTSYWRRLVEVQGNTNVLSDIVARGGSWSLSWGTNIPAQHVTGTLEAATLPVITSNMIDAATDAAYRGGGSGGDSAFTTNAVGATYAGTGSVFLGTAAAVYLPALPVSPVGSNAVGYADMAAYVAANAVAASNATSVFEIDLEGILVPKLTAVTGDPLFEQEGSWLIVPRAP